MTFKKRKDALIDETGEGADYFIGFLEVPAALGSNFDATPI